MAGRLAEERPHTAARGARYVKSSQPKKLIEVLDQHDTLDSDLRDLAKSAPAGDHGRGRDRTNPGANPPAAMAVRSGIDYSGLLEEQLVRVCPSLGRVSAP